jgi:uncharacterized protein MTH_692
MEIFIFLVILALILVFVSVKQVQQGQVGLIETLGKYTKTVNSGLAFLIPGVQTLRRVDIREQVVNVPEQQIITMDNVSMAVDGIIYVQITDPFQATYDVNNVFMAVVSLAQTNLRSVLGTMSLDETLSNRDTINARLLTSLDKETGKWGVKVLRVEIKRLDPPDDIQDAMSKQMKAEREKRAQILEAEGYRQSQITRSEGDKQSAILQAEGQKQAAILQAEGDARAEIALAEAKAKALELEATAAVQFFNGAAVTKEQLKVIEGALGQNTKYILDSDILAGVSKIFGNAK